MCSLISVGKATRKLSCWILVTFRRHLQLGVVGEKYPHGIEGKE